MCSTEWRPDEPDWQFVGRWRAAIGELIVRTMELMLLIWMIHAAVAAVLSAPILLLGARRVQWRAWELLAFILPFGAWWLLAIRPGPSSRKGISNIGEPLIFSLTIPLAALTRVLLGKSFNEATCAGAIL